MTAALRILSPGLSTTLQDLGRPGYRHLGVSLSGALDSIALRAANAIVGNPEDTGALEVLYSGPSFVVEADDAHLAFAGAAAAIEICADAEASRGELIAPMRSVRVRGGQVVRIGSLRHGATLYIAVEGGFAVAPALGSVATDSRGRLGGWHARALVAGDALPLRRACSSDRGEQQLIGLDLSPASRFRVILGPQSDYFADDEIERFLAAKYVVSAESNRVGMRLHGRALQHRRGFNIVSDAIAPGSIQIPGNGQPIVLLADHQTTGGYPKIATVISADLPAIGRLPIGSEISFEAISVEQAAAARREQFALLERLVDKIVPLGLPAATVMARLLEHNLISGVCDAAA